MARRAFSTGSNGCSAARSEASGRQPRPPSVGGDVANGLTSDITVTITRSVALELIARAGFVRDGRGRWVNTDGRWTWATDEALTWALVAIAEQD